MGQREFALARNDRDIKFVRGGSQHWHRDRALPCQAHSALNILCRIRDRDSQNIGLLAQREGHKGLKYSAVSGAATNQRAERDEIDVKSVRKLAHLRGYSSYPHSHTVVNKLELVALSDSSHMKNRLTKRRENAFSHRKQLFIRSNDSIEKA